MKYDPFSGDGLTGGKITLITSGETFTRLTGITDYSLIMIQTTSGATDEDVAAIRQIVEQNGYTMNDKRDERTSGTYFAFVACVYAFPWYYHAGYCDEHHEQHLYECIYAHQAVWFHAGGGHGWPPAFQDDSGRSLHLCFLGLLHWLRDWLALQQNDVRFPYHKPIPLCVLEPACRVAGRHRPVCHCRGGACRLFSGKTDTNHLGDGNHQRTVTAVMSRYKHREKRTMRTLRKTIVRLLLLVIAAAVMAGCVLIGRGYQMYQAALTQQSLESKVEEIQSDPGYTELSGLPEMYLNAVVAVEDHRFEQHFGIDLIAIGRAAWNNLTTWSLREGGSTITQQLAKNMYFTQEKSFIRKVAEMFMAFRLERAYTKEEILELYVNSIYFGDGYYGIGDACEGYLSESPIEMTDYECTLMAGIPNAPSVYSLTENPVLAEQRQKYVVKQMVKYDYITEDQAKTITK